MEFSATEEAELQLLRKCPINEVPRILHFTVDKICGRKPTVNYSEFQKIWTSTEWWRVTKIYYRAIRDIVKNKRSKHDIEKLFHFLPADFQLAIQDCLSSRQEEIVQILLTETCSISNPCLVDFDWQLKLAIGSDKIANIKKPIASIVLNTSSEENIGLEMNKDELAKFITSLEQANKAISQLQTQ